MNDIISAYIRIMRSGLFMHHAYAAKYLGSSRRRFFALLHFLLIGERKGNVANPFVDSNLCDVSGARISLSQLCKRRSRFVSPGSHFDPRWYAGQYLVDRPRVHPLRDFWARGFDRSFRPSASFDIEYFKKTVTLFYGDKKQGAFDLMSNGRNDFPRSEKDLQERQARFAEAVTIRVVEANPTARRFLLFIQSASSYRHGFDDRRSFDILLNVYDGGAIAADRQAEIVIAQNGTKTTAIRRILDDMPDLLTRYEAVLFLDDDVEMRQQDIEQSFGLFDDHGLDLAQPALSEESECNYAALKQPTAGVGIRPISMVEIMMPIVSRRALVQCGAAFGAAVSGWGVDALLSKLVRARFGETIALIADVTAVHARPIDLQGGAYYRFLASFGIDPSYEQAAIATRYGTSPGADAVFFMNDPAPACDVPTPAI